MMKVLFWLQLFCAVVAVVNGDEAKTCCQTLKFKDRCHYMCDSSIESSNWDAALCLYEKAKYWTSCETKKVDGKLTYWSTWTDCSKTCGGGSKSRLRTCTPPKHGGSPCSGRLTDTRQCNNRNCPDDEARTCCQTLNFKDRCHYMCDSSIKSSIIDTAMCVVEKVKYWKSCETKKIDGELSDWSTWTDCSKTCGGGSKSRLRTCTPPKHGGSPCSGRLTDTRQCNNRNCPDDEARTCCQTLNFKDRCHYMCDSSIKSSIIDKGMCLVENFKYRNSCETKKIDGELSDWSTWNSCSKTCGGGLKSRSRTCTPPKHGGSPCSGTLTDSRQCNNQNCLGDEAKTCCQTLNFKDRCHFLCDSSLDSSYWDQLACVYQRTQLFGCKTKETYDVVKLFGKEFIDTVQDNWLKMKTDLKKKLEDVSKFVSVAIDELKTLGQDLLSSMTTLTGMTKGQFTGIMQRFQDFTSENLRQIFDKVDVNIIYGKFDELSKYNWDKTQLSILVKSAYKKYNKNIQQWTSVNLRKLGKLIGGIPSVDLNKLSNEAFENSLDKICETHLSFQQKVNLMIPAKSVFGDVTTWSSATLTKLCNLVSVMTPAEILSMKAKEIENSLVALQKQFLTPDQKNAIVKKLKKQWGGISKWTSRQVQQAKEFAEGFELSDIIELNKDQIKEWLNAGKVRVLSKVQQSALFKQIVMKYGEPNTWPKNILEEGIELMSSLTVDDLTKLTKTHLIAALEKARNVEWSQDQAEFFLKIIRSDSTKLAKMSKEQIVKLGSILKAFSESDVGELTEKALYLAFPKLVLVRRIGEPVIRHFVRVYKSESKYGEIKSLGQYVTALTRHEISEHNIADLLGNLEQLTGIDFDEAQAAQIMIKLRKELGNMSLTEHSDKDKLAWGFQNLKKIGKVILSLTRKEAASFPFRGIENTIEELGKQDGWKRRMVLTFLKRMKENWKEQNMIMNDLKEIDVEILGKFVQGFTLSELDELTDEVKVTAIQKLGEYTGLPEDKLKSRANFAYNYFKKLRGGELQSSDVKTMGNLLSGLSRELLDKLPSSDLADRVENLLEGVDADKFEEVVKKLKSVYKESELRKWTAQQWEKVIPLLSKLPSYDELKEMSPDTFDELLVHLGAVKTWSKRQAEVLLQKAKDKWGEDLSKWDGKIIHQIGSILRGISADDVSKLSKEFFDKLNSNLLEGENFGDELRKALAQRFSKVYLNNDLKLLSYAQLKRFHYFLAGLDVNQLKEIVIDSIDKIDALGSSTGWNQEQVEALAGKALKYINDDSNISTYYYNDGTLIIDGKHFAGDVTITGKQYGIDEKRSAGDVTITGKQYEMYLSIKNLLRGFTKDQIKNIPDDAFQLAAGKFGKTTGLSDEQKRELAKKAKKVWGDVSRWTGAHVSEAGNWIGGLDSDDISRLNPTEINRIPESVFGSLPKEKLQAFTINQLLELDNGQIDSLSEAQINDLPASKASAIRSVQNEDPKDDNPYPTLYQTTRTRTISKKIFISTVLPTVDSGNPYPSSGMTSFSFGINMVLISLFTTVWFTCNIF